MTALKVGQRVLIYQKPFTFEDFEGEAVIVKVLKEVGQWNDYMEYHLMVRFLAEDETYFRRYLHLLESES